MTAQKEVLDAHQQRVIVMRLPNYETAVPLVDSFVFGELDELSDSRDHDRLPGVRTRSRGSSELDSFPNRYNRTFRVVISMRLIPMSFMTGDKLIKPFLETIRSHFFLWSLGIEHGDISETNLIVSEDGHGVLNDFDLATVSGGDQRTPPTDADTRTGTMPFMALDLLKPTGNSGQVTRLYRHDLESFCWVLTWICCCYDKGKMLTKHPLHRWLTNDPVACQAAKILLAHESGGLKLTASYQDLNFQELLLRALWIWPAITRDRDMAFVLTREYEEPASIEFLRKVLDIFPESNVDFSWAFSPNCVI